MGNASFNASDGRKNNGFYKSSSDKAATSCPFPIPVPFAFKPQTLCIRQTLRLPASQGNDKPRDIVVLRRVHVLAELTVPFVAANQVSNDNDNNNEYQRDNNDNDNNNGALVKAVNDLCRMLGMASNIENIQHIDRGLHQKEHAPSALLSSASSSNRTLRFYVVKAADAHLGMPVPGAKQVGPLAVVAATTLEKWLSSSIDI